MSEDQPRVQPERTVQAIGSWKAQYQQGNQLWKRAVRIGLQRTKYLDPEEFMEQICGYFQWLEENPLQEAKAFSYEGSVTIEPIDKMRAPTIVGMCLYIGIDVTTYQQWRNPKDSQHRANLVPIMRWAESVIREGKYTGAAAGLLNPAMVMRDLGMVDRSQVQGPGGGPVSLISTNMDPKDAAEAYRAMLSSPAGEIDGQADLSEEGGGTGE